MDREDTDIVAAERDADPQAFQGYDPNNSFQRTYDREHPELLPGGQVPPVEAVEERDASDDSSAPSIQQEKPQTLRNRSYVSRQVTNTDAVEEEFMHYLDRHPTAVGRIQQHRLQHSRTVGSNKLPSGAELPAFGGNKPYPAPLPNREEYVVEFDGHKDPRHALNWPWKKKLVVASISILNSFAAAFASSVFSPTGGVLQHKYNVGQEVTTLTVSLFVLGYVFGPIIFAPISELYGRRLPLIVASFGFGIFNIAVAVSKDFQTLIICRFFAGLFGSCPLTLVPAVFADIYNNETRGLAVALFAACVVQGPLMGPFIGGFITKSYLGWRWTAYIPAFIGFASSILTLLFQAESYGPVILVSKAAELRRLTRNWGIHAKQEEVEVSIKELISKNVSRPLRLLFTEPIVLLVTIYISFLYGLLYLNLTAFAIVFELIHGFSLGVAGLPFFGVIIGVFLGLALFAYDMKSYIKKLRANNNIPVPEWRLPMAMYGGVIFVIGMFWFGWTGYKKDIHWIVPTIAGSFIGFGIYVVFLQCLNYIIDAYLMFAASAVAANTIMRSTFGAVFPLFAAYMYQGIGVQWGQTFLGCLGAVFIPVPFIFYYYGPRIRVKSKFAPALDIEQDKRKDLESKGVQSESDASSSGKESKED